MNIVLRREISLASFFTGHVVLLNFLFYGDLHFNSFLIQEHGDNSDADLNIHVNELHTSQLARNPSQEHDYPAKSDHAAHEAIVEYHSRRSPGSRNHNEAHSKDCL